MPDGAGESILIDDDGRELASFEAMQEEATLSLAEMGPDAISLPGSDYRMSMEVRNERGPVLKVNCAFEVKRIQAEVA